MKNRPHAYIERRETYKTIESTYLMVKHAFFDGEDREATRSTVTSYHERQREGNSQPNTSPKRLANAKAHDERWRENADSQPLAMTTKAKQHYTAIYLQKTSILTYKCGHFAAAS